MSLPALKYAHGASHSLPLLLVVLRFVVVEHLSQHILVKKTLVKKDTWQKEVVLDTWQKAVCKWYQKFSDKKSMNQILGKKCMEWILIKIMNSSVINLVILLSVSNMSQGSVIGQYHPTWEEGDDSLNRLLAGLNMTYPVIGSSSELSVA